jgi:hypothetical protein
MNVFATLRQFLVAIIILLCSASAEALPPRTKTTASISRDMIRIVREPNPLTNPCPVIIGIRDR